MNLQLETKPKTTVSNGRQIEELLTELKRPYCSFFILERDDGSFLQAAEYKNGYMVEKQEGDLSRHYRALQGGEIAAFTFEEISKLALSYFEKRELGLVETWQNVDLKSESEPIEPQTGTMEHNIHLWNKRTIQLQSMFVRMIALPFLTVGALYVIYLIVENAVS